MTHSTKLFLEKLQPPNFCEIAQQGCYVYAYLRTADGTPYYIGIASNAKRPLQRHNCIVPKERSRIRILRSKLTWEQACSWEMFYIKRYGRKNIGTGILRNLTDGGEGILGLVITEKHRANLSAALKSLMTPEYRTKMSESAKARMTPEYRARLSAARRGKKLTAEHCASMSVAVKLLMTPEHRAKIGAAVKLAQTPEVIAKRAESLKGKKRTLEQRAKMSASMKNIKKTPEHRAKLSMVKCAKTVAMLGISFEEYIAMSRYQREKARVAHKKAKNRLFAAE